jgi:hypothetical protein
VVIVILGTPGAEGLAMLVDAALLHHYCTTVAVQAV